MDERTLEKTSGFQRLSSDFAAAVSQLGAAIVDGLLSGREAAE